MQASRTWLAAAGALAVLPLLAPAADAADPLKVHGVRFERQLESAAGSLPLHGAGLLRYKRLIPVYAAALYLPPAARTDPLADVPKRLEVEYLVSAAARDFTTAGDRILAGTLPPAELAALRERLDRLNSWYPDPKRGDRCAVTYIPGRGTELSFNGRVLGVIPGEDFQRAYFSIWLGSEPASRGLKESLLGDGRGGAEGGDRG